jgi:hypothetical protein
MAKKLRRGDMHNLRIDEILKKLRDASKDQVIVFTAPMFGHEVGHLAILQDNGYIQCGEKCGGWTKDSEFGSFQKSGPYLKNYEILGPFADPQLGDVVVYTGDLFTDPDLYGEIGVVTKDKKGEAVSVLVPSVRHFPDTVELSLLIKNLEIIDHDEDLLKESKSMIQEFLTAKPDEDIMGGPYGSCYRTKAKEHPWDKDLREHYHQHGQNTCSRPQSSHPEAPMSTMGVYEIHGRRVQVDLHPGVAGEIPSIKFTCCCCGSKLLDLPIEFPHPAIANRKWISDTHEMGK